MRGFFVGSAAVALCGMTPVAASAQDSGTVAEAATGEGSHIRAAVTAGTLGIGPEVGFRLSDHVGIRASATFLGASGEYESEDVQYDGKLKLKSYGAMLDVFPFGGHFHLSAGARINSNRIDVGATPSAGSGSTVSIGDEEYTATQVGRLSGSAVTRRLSPALTLGWTGRNRTGFYIGSEIGILFQGAYKLRDFRASGTLKDDAGFKAALENERQSLQDDVDVLKLWPIAQLTIGWRF